MNKYKISKSNVKYIKNNNSIKIFSKLMIEQGLLVFYFDQNYRLYAALFNKCQEKSLLWRSIKPLWKFHSDIELKDITYKNDIATLYYKDQEKLYTHQLFINFPYKLVKPSVTRSIKRAENNPVLSANPDHAWESLAVFNPAALLLNGEVHLLYRAIGHAGISTLGYARSQDGLHIQERRSQPVYSQIYPHSRDAYSAKIHAYCYQSGINGGGCEDPRLTQIEDKIYMTYTAFDGYHPPGVALTSIDINDFINHRWHYWHSPILISDPKITQKNWVLFPEKINSKYALLHSIAPEILITYLDDLNFSSTTFIYSQYNPIGRENYWDNWTRGVGSPPIKTEHGWLLLYHAMDKNDPGRYKIGVMLLSLNEPTKVLARSPHPLLEPDKNYENQGFKSGVIYTCGAVLKNDTLFIYYGGADTVTCVALIKLEKLMEHLIDTDRTLPSCSFIKSAREKQHVYG